MTEKKNENPWVEILKAATKEQIKFEREMFWLAGVFGDAFEHFKKNQTEIENAKFDPVIEKTDND